MLSLTYISSINLEEQTERYQTRIGKISFKASVPAFEPIEAINESTTVVLDLESGNIAALMQEHFNENYMESDEYPKATIKGNLTGFTPTALSQNISKTFTLDGTLELHGVTQPISIPVVISRTGKSILLSSNFSIDPEIYDIKIPNIVADKIADDVLITVKAELLKK